ncbi:hypothetical protein F5J12DRAFT_760109 [Pisolithus orientalis]|uniref:uncharacterized protein n=1 Tax=Pisolithus orientalis TaxID=936130 RepID=UPI002225166F|nr:uncharacterized protein F5J12DRAFT_760109 [Pisolithus orientalis]KAI6035253.1 hypothetical protein F5J12DRAFT_760109 [Pisolithus orientalis]KAI6152037.1 hypothetical protein BKA82DRAFT_4106311 [Pisolithus tinctorius]
MATSSVAESNQQLWDETLGRLLNLSSATLKRNAELENRVAELEVELAVWKQAHATALEGADREAKALKGRLTALNGQVDSLVNHCLLVLCVIDGDACIFNESLLRQGHEGGRQAAQQLTKAVAEYLTRENVHTLGHLSFWITVYYNRLGLINVLERHKLCTPEQFEAFVMGFSQTSPRFSLVDVGYGRDATFTKIAEYLQTYIRFPQTQRIFLAGSCDNTYVSTITALQNDDLLNKLAILEKTGEDQGLSRRFRLPPLTLDNVFMSQRFTPPPLVTLPPLNVTGLSPRDSNGGLPTPHSPPVLSVSSNGKLIDPTLPLHKHSPPPCNEYYLMSCTKGSTCKYSHEYVLTPEQLATLAANAKKAPCNFLKNGLQCPYGERCCWGHTCPNGPKCFHLSKGKCWFKGESMHNLPLVQTS